MSNNVKNIQLAFGYPPYLGAPNLKRGPKGYYDLRGLVRHWLHYNGLFTPTIITESGSWDALVARITADPNFPQPLAGVAPVFPRSSSPSTWQGDQCKYMCNFVRELCKSWDKSVSYREYIAKFDKLWQRGATRIVCHEYARCPPRRPASGQDNTTTLGAGPGEPIPHAPEMMAWAVANVANIAFILPGGNPHYGLPPPGPPQPLPLLPAPIIDAIAITRAIQSVVTSLEIPLQGYANVLLHAQWKEIPGVVGSFVVIDSATVPKVNATSELFPWRGPDELAGGIRVREVLIALTNFDEDSSWVPTRFIGINNIRHIHLWAAQMDTDLRRHLIDGGTVFVQAVELVLCLADTWSPPS
ncbi:hypothetical protein BGX38DRAFT_1280683 [Terfezia claveryi]|nr:hypothetical protein BGX38DRAFT_1280683 [Terfezia claveryi]